MPKTKPLKDNDYYQTPPDIFTPHLRWLGLSSYHLDPCSPVVVKSYHVPALRRYGERDNGLKLSWGGDREHVFLNPPYSQYEEWIHKAVRESERVYIWALLNQSNANIWQDVINQQMQFKIALRQRVKFILEGVQQSSPRYDNYLVHFGPDDDYLQLLLANPEAFPLNGELIHNVTKVGRL